jgi:tetratricopeptide (TPR) repeat protein
MVSTTKTPQVSSPEWREWLDRGDRQNLHLRRDMLEEFLVFRPEFGLLWSKLAYLEGTRQGNWVRSYRLREAGASKELVEHHWVRAQIAYALLRLGRFDESVLAYEKAAESPRDLRNSSFQWIVRRHAEALVGAGRSDDALTLLDTLRNEWMGTQPGYWGQRAEILALLGRAEEAAQAQATYERLIAKTDGR